MDNQSMLVTMRQATIQTIAINPTGIELMRLPLKDNGLGVNLPDPFGSAQARPIQTMRICSRPVRGGAAREAIQGDVVESEQIYFVIAQYDADLQKDDYFTANNKKYTVGEVEPIYEFGDIIHVQADLQISTPEPAAVDS